MTDEQDNPSGLTESLNRALAYMELCGTLRKIQQQFANLCQNVVEPDFTTALKELLPILTIDIGDQFDPLFDACRHYRADSWKSDYGKLLATVHAVLALKMHFARELCKVADMAFSFAAKINWETGITREQLDQQIERTKRAQAEFRDHLSTL